MDDVFEQVAAMRRAGQRGVLATIVEVRGSAPREVGARMLVHPDGRIHGTVGGGALEHRVRALAPEVLAEGRARLERFDLGQDLGMGCGGFTTVFLEPLGVAHRLLLFGAGHIAEHLCDMAARCAFQVVVCDERDELRTPERFPRATVLSTAGTAERLGELDEAHLADPAHTYVVVVTHSHSLDFALVAGLLPHRPGYLAMIGSRSKRNKLDAHLREAGATDEERAQVRSPAGIPLGGRAPAEIAVSILAELVQVRAGQKTAHEPGA
jgi:xanthine dehydrogenase accessory factor